MALTLNLAAILSNVCVLTINRLCNSGVKAIASQARTMELHEAQNTAASDDNHAAMFADQKPIAVLQSVVKFKAERMAPRLRKAKSGELWP